jgi:hypothetical protein
MAIIGALPVNLTDGTTADASQVMADFNYIANQVNAGAMPISPDGFTSNGSIVNTGTFTNTGVVTINDSSSENALVINGASDANGANINFAGNGSGAADKTIRVFDTNFQIMNSAYTTAIMNMDDLGDATFLGTVSGSNLTGTSDERLKKDWTALPKNFLQRLARVKHGEYTRIDTGERQVGVGAQSLRRVLKTATGKDKNGMWAVAYGHAALVSAIELAQKVVEQEKTIRKLERRLAKLERKT